MIEKTFFVVFRIMNFWPNCYDALQICFQEIVEIFLYIAVHDDAHNNANLREDK